MTSLKELSQQYATFLGEHPFNGKPAGLYEPMNYIMSLGGKRVRPLLTLIGAQTCRGDVSAALPVAHAMEVFHNFTLLHDDIMDNAPTRRGMTTVHEKWGLAEGILSGDNMLIAVYQMLLDYNGQGRNEILQLMTKTAREVCEGQQMDMDSATSASVTAHDYLEMIRLKTAVLLGCSLQCGALSAGAAQAVQQKLYDFAIQLGMSFQLQDDWLDAFGDAALTGKKPGGDIAEGKKTWLYIRAAETEDIAALWRTHEGDSRVSLTLEMFGRLGLDRELRELSDSYYRLALQQLEMLETEHGIQTELLKSLADWLQVRQH